VTLVLLDHCTGEEGEARGRGRVCSRPYSVICLRLSQGAGGERGRNASYFGNASLGESDFHFFTHSQHVSAARYSGEH
jgi:hypothetical protein